MLNENAKKWVAALRSGKYKQAKGALTELDENGNVTGHCCLGVACELALENGIPLEVRKNEKLREYNKQPAILPFDVVSWLGLATSGGEYLGGKLTSKNDNGTPFPEIADIIESEPTGLFAEAV